MRVHVKMLLITLVLIAALILPTGFIFYRYNTGVLLDETSSELATLAQKLSLQVEARIQQIDGSLLFVLSDPDFLSSVAFYTMPERDAVSNRLVLQDSASSINRLFRSYAVSKHFYKMVMFDLNGDYFTSDIAEELPWLQQTRDNKGLLTLLPPARDPWSKDGEMVYGAARSIATASGTICYLQVQRRVLELEELLTISRQGNISAQLLDKNGDVYFSVGEISAPEDRLIRVESELNSYGLRAVLSMDRRNALGSQYTVGLQIGFICVLAMAFSMVYIYVSIGRITRPLRALEQAMDQTMLYNLGGREAPWRTDELKSLCDAYTHLCARLNVAVEEKMLAQSLEMQARLDALQAQIDPHFIYNTLNVIMSRAVLKEDEETLCLCEGLSEMIRYSTSTKQRMATVLEEADHLENYLCLMKIRYKHRLEYEIDIPDDFEKLPMPKIVLQPIAENAIRHGFSHTGGIMRVCVKGFRDDRGCRIEVTDNGEGFAPDVLDKLKAQMEKIRMGRYRPENFASIGGMGLVNTFARLYYFYGDRCRMLLENGDCGARVTIAIPDEEGEKEIDSHIAGGR